MGGLFTRWNHDRVQDVFDPWASLYSYPGSSHAGHEVEGETETCVRTSPITSVAITETRTNDPPPSDHLHGSTDFEEQQPMTLPQYYDGTSDSSISTDSDLISLTSGSHKPSRRRAKVVELQLQNTELKKALQVQQAEVSELRTQLSSLRGELASTTASYERLLARVIPTPNNFTQSPLFRSFFRILKFARAANSKLPIYLREDYVGQFYWTEESFVRENRDGLTVIRDEHSGPLPFLVGENGIVVSGQRQDRLFRFGRMLYNTLLKYEMAPRAWVDIDVYALEWFCLAIRIKCLEFRLCDDHWKAEAFASINYGKWQQPHGATMASQESEMIWFRQMQEAETSILAHVSPASQSARDNRGQWKHKEIAVQVAWSPNTSMTDVLEPAENSPATDTETHAEDTNNDVLLVCNSVKVKDDDADSSGYPIILPIEVYFTRNPTSTDPTQTYYEDPPDYLELKEAERSRTEANKVVHKEKQRQFERLKDDPIYKAKAHGKEKKQYHVHSRKELGNFISSCLDNFELEREMARRNEAKARQRMAKWRAYTKRRQAEKQAVKSTKKEQEEQREWEQRADIRRRLDNLVKYVDRLERAYRKEEGSLLAREFAEESTADHANFLMTRKAQVESEDGLLAINKRLSRMLPDFQVYHDMVISQRVKEFRMKQREAGKKITEEKEQRLKEKRERETREAQQTEAAARQRLETKMLEERAKLTTMQQQGRFSSIPVQAPMSKKSQRKTSEVINVTPKYRPTVLESRTVAQTQVADRSDAQAEARAKAQAEFQARMKARLDAQAAASADRQRELEHAVALEGARRKAQRTEADESSAIPTHLIDTPRPWTSTTLPAHRTSYVATSPGTPPSATTSESVVPRHISGWRRSTAMTQGGSSMALHTPPDPLHFPNDSSGVFGRSAKSPQVPLTPVAPHVGPSTHTMRVVKSTKEAVISIRQPRADNTSANAPWGTKRTANPSTLTTKVVDDTKAMPGVRYPKTPTTIAQLPMPYKVWKPARLETKG